MMKYKYKNLAGILILSVVFSLVSCSNNDSLTTNELEKDAMLNFAIKAGPANDPLTKGGDGAFSSLALYIFNKATGYCEYSQLIPVFTPQTVQEFSKSVNVSQQTKIIYAIANYVDSKKTFSIPITAQLTMAQIEALTVANNDALFYDSNILMIGKQEVAINSSYVTAEIPMQRLVARLDIYMFKGSTAQSTPIEVSSVEFRNQITNSNCIFQSHAMMPTPTKTNITKAFSPALVLTTMPSDVSTIIPVNANASFYSYQNIAPSATVPSDATTPYLNVSYKVNGASHTAKGYIGDNGQGVNKYSLMRNNVYRVIAIMDKIDNQLTIKTTIYPWTVNSSEIGHNVRDTDYVLNAFSGNTGATTGIVQYPYVLNGVGKDETSYASYSFKLTAPPGAVWVATLTNGLDFTFNSVGTTPGKLAVSTGITRAEEYEIKVGATKTWGGTARTTYMYITVDGIKLKINPIVTGTTRKFPGSNDTDILITQTKYQ